MKRVEELLMILNAALVGLEEYSTDTDNWCEEELAEIRHNLELIKDDM